MIEGIELTIGFLVVVFAVALISYPAAAIVGTLIAGILLGGEIGKRAARRRLLDRAIDEILTEAERERQT